MYDPFKRARSNTNKRLRQATVSVLNNLSGANAPSCGTCERQGIQPSTVILYQVGNTRLHDTALPLGMRSEAVDSGTI